MHAKHGTPSAAKTAARPWSCAGRALVREGEQHDAGHAGPHERGDAQLHLTRQPAFEEIGHEDQHGVGRPADQALAVREGSVDVGPTAELDAEEDVDRIVEERGEVDDLSAERHHGGAQRRHGGQRRAHDAGVHRGLCHGARLVDGDDELPLDGRRQPTEADDVLRHEGPPLRQPVAEVGLDGPVPVDVARPGAAGARCRRSAPLTAWCSGRASRASISATTVATMRRAVARASSGR